MLRALFGKKKPVIPHEICPVDGATDFYKKYGEYYESERFFDRLDWVYLGFCVGGTALGGYVGWVANEEDDTKEMGAYVGLGHGFVGTLAPPIGAYFVYLYARDPDYFKCTRELNESTGKWVTSWPREHDNTKKEIKD